MNTFITNAISFSCGLVDYTLHIAKYFNFELDRWEIGIR